MQSQIRCHLGKTHHGSGNLQEREDFVGHEESTRL